MLPVHSEAAATISLGLQALGAWLLLRAWGPAGGTSRARALPGGAVEALIAVRGAQCRAFRAQCRAWAVAGKSCGLHAEQRDQKLTDMVGSPG